jgi:hypothetical protein
MGVVHVTSRISRGNDKCGKLKTGTTYRLIYGECMNRRNLMYLR